MGEWFSKVWQRECNRSALTYRLRMLILCQQTSKIWPVSQQAKIGNCFKVQALFWGVYRPGQPDWKYTMWKFQDNSAIQILREIKFGHFEPPKTSILTIWAALNFGFLGTFDIFKCEIFPKIKIQSLQNCYNCSFWPSEISQNWLHVKSECQRNC